MARPPRTPPTFRRLLRAAARRLRAAEAPESPTRRLLRERALPRRQPLSRSREKLLIEAQRLVFRQIHRRFAEKTRQGERGLGPALAAFDSLWRAVRDLHDGAPFLVETLALSGQEGPLADHLSGFYAECTALLEDGIRRIFDEELDRLTVPPARMAILIRICLEGLLVELAQARDADDLAAVEQAYADVRELFQRFVLANTEPSALDPDGDGSDVPLPW